MEKVYLCKKYMGIMATITFSLDIPEAKSYDISEFQQKLKAYARMLVEMPMLSMPGMKRQKTMLADGISMGTALSREEAEKFIHSLPIRNGKNIPAEINGIKDLPNPKYM